MVVIGHKQARRDLKNYAQKSRLYAKNKLQTYLNSLIKYTDSLKFCPYLGKVFYIYKETKIRQLLYKMHRIIYYIEDNEIIILAVIHTSRNTNSIIKYLINFLDKS